MDPTTGQTKLWSAAQAYALSVICLVLGLLSGYLLHGPVTARVILARSSEHVSQASVPQVAQVTPEQLKQMADKTAEPLLAQLQKRPNDGALLAEIGRAFFAANQFSNSQEYYERSAAIKPDPVVLTQLASAYYFAGDADRAIATLHRALKVEPNYADALFNLGMVQWRGKSDPKAAITAWEQLLRAHPHHPKRAQVEEVIARARQHMNIPPGSKTDKPAM